jgi:hypothetical protein
MSAALEAAFERGERSADPAEVAEADSRLEELLDKVDAPVSSVERAEVSAEDTEPIAVASLPSVSTRTAVAVSLNGRAVSLRVRGVAEPVEAMLDRGVAREVVKEAIVRGDRVVVEQVDGEQPLVVGVLQTRVAEDLTLRAKRIHIEAEQEVLLRSGRGAVRIRQDGDVELVGSRISAMSRGLFRLVGRVLRLN